MPNTTQNGDEPLNELDMTHAPPTRLTLNESPPPAYIEPNYASNYVNIPPAVRMLGLITLAVQGVGILTKMEPGSVYGWCATLLMAITTYTSLVGWVLSVYCIGYNKINTLFQARAIDGVEEGVHALFKSVFIEVGKSLVVVGLFSVFIVFSPSVLKLVGLMAIYSLNCAVCIVDSQPEQIALDKPNGYSIFVDRASLTNRIYICLCALSLIGTIIFFVESLLVFNVPTHPYKALEALFHFI
ncbi:hypothetical protein NEDG_00056 [Nematocida displodere]|uniref:Uncharacterized protein n=1 Tax=Nematocida displodere TaxID=1805483 RepID=A0A177EJD4_9MICR|nr:hypothetical protein NEDG_00056 [Nematocida displodere]